MYCGVNTQIFHDIPCVSGAISAAELLQSQHPKISGAFLQYASCLVQNFLAQAGSTPEIDQAFLMLKQVASNCQVADQKELETFGDSLIASADEPFASDFYRIGYIAYASSSIYGPLSPRVLNKIANANQYLHLNDNISQSQILPNGPPQFNAGGPPQFTPNGPPQFTPNGPPQFNTNVTTQTLPNVNSQYNSTFPQYPTSNMPGTTQNRQANALKLTEMAKSALASGSNDVAFSLIFGAMQELQKK